MRRDRCVSNLATLAAAALLLAACGPSEGGDSADVDLNTGPASIKSAQDNTAVSLTIDGEKTELTHLLNCTISPMITGVVAMERNDMENPGAMLRINAHTQENATAGDISYINGDIEYAYRGPIQRDGKTLLASGKFQKLNRSEMPPAELGEVEVKVSVSC